MKRLVSIIIILISYTSLSYSKEINCASHNVYVIDADTIKLCNMKIRLNGISAAERGHATYKPCKKIVEKIIAESDTVSCKLTGDMTYDRHVGICRVTKKDKTEDTYIFKGERKKKKDKFIKFDKNENPFKKLLSLNIK